jgi:uncharacterized protein with FMN-binding domain
MIRSPRRTLSAVALGGVLASHAASAVAAVESSTVTSRMPSKKVVTQRFTGTAAEADRWGPVVVSIAVRKTTTTDASGKKKVTRKMTALTVTEYPRSNPRSASINEQALPILKQEALTAQSASIDAVSGATDTSYAFAESLNAAILAALKA